MMVEFDEVVEEDHRRCTAGRSRCRRIACAGSWCVVGEFQAKLAKAREHSTGLPDHDFVVELEQAGDSREGGRRGRRRVVR